MTEWSRRRRRRQMVDTKELPQRARYYQSICDGVVLSKGDFYTNLKEQYIIFLCPIDIFGRGYPVYHFENRAREDTSVALNYLTYKNYYIFTKYKDFKDPVVKAYMKYFATKNADPCETQTINDQVSFYKADTLIRSKFMTFEYELHEREEKVKLEMVDAMIANDIPIEKISVISGIPQDEIEKRRA